MLTSGSLLSGRYEIMEKIGSGGMAEVYKAKDDRLGRIVAIKVLKPEYAADATVVAKFHKEALAAAGLSHNNIVGVYDMGRQGDWDYIVMEYVDGITLREYIRRRRQLNSEEILKITVRIAEALKVAHENDIVHRDIKPQNILVTPRGAIKVADFGIAKAVSSSTITTQKDAMGSVHYLSPEQARGAHADARSDLYSLGITMYEMATGHVPFNGETPVSIAMQHLHDPLPDPCRENAELWPGLGDMIRKLTRKNPEDRYQSAQELIEDLKRFYKNPDLRLPEEEVRDLPSKKQEKTAPVRSNPEEVKKKKQKIILISAAGLTVAVLLIFMLFYGFLDRAQAGLIPNITGMKLEDAVQSAKNKGYSITELEPQYHDTVPEGCIISQVPGENYEADPGTVIQVVVSLGVREVSKTPDMTGKTFIQAVQELNQLGIIYDVVIQNDPAEDDPKDIAVVFDQMPEPGSDFENSETGEKKTLTLYVSTGNADILVKVPPLENKTEAEAETLLAEAGLRLGEVTREHHDSIEEGKIIAQSHGAGSSAARDTAVSITVSDGPGEDQTIRKTGGSITIANPLMATEDGHLSVIAYDKDGRQTTLFNADITYFTFSEDNKTMTLAYPDDTWYIRVNLNYVELLYLNVNH